ncbi:MAG: MBL fold metallo-hydrolase [Gemmatimonadaceae bacterium]
MQGSTSLCITYVGHATLLVELGGVRLVTDPNFDAKLGWLLPRVSAPGIAIRDLPVLDALLLTHAHADHLSFAALDALPRDIPLLCPPAVARWLNRRGYRHAEAIAPGETRQIGQGERALTITAAAAKHLGSRYWVDRWRSSANMYLLDTTRASVFFAGDTALTPDSHRVVEERLHSTGRKLDVALLPIGHAPWWKPRYRTGHMTSADALDLFERLGSRYMIPYHWGTFRHVTAGPFDAITELREVLPGHARRSDVKIIEPGASFALDTATL